MSEPDTEFADVLAVLEAAQPGPAPEGLEARVQAALDADTTDNDSDALDRFGDDVYALLLALIGDPTAARDALEETFFRLGRSSKKGDIRLADALRAAGAAGLEARHLLEKTGATADETGTLALVDSQTQLLLRLRGGFRLGAAELALAGGCAKGVDPDERLARASGDLARALRLPAHEDAHTFVRLTAEGALDLLDESGRQQLDAHLSACSICAMQAERLREELELPFTKLEDRDAVAAAVTARREQDQRHRDAVQDVATRVSLNCTYCHSAMQRSETAFCSTCLAPHHSDCFREHARCAAPGCGETQAVQPGTLPSPIRSPLQRWLPRILSVAIGLGAVAAIQDYRERLTLDRERLQTEAFGEQKRQLNEELSNRRQELTQLDMEMALQKRELEVRLSQVQSERDELQNKLERRWQEFMDQATEQDVSPEDLITQMRAEFASSKRIGALDRELEERFARIESLAQRRQVEQLIGEFTELRKIMERYGNSGSEAVRASMKKWRDRLASFGEVQLSIQLQVYISDGNRLLKHMASALPEKNGATLRKQFGKLLVLCSKMGAEEREVFHRNANALYLRGRAMAIRAGGVPGIVASLNVDTFEFEALQLKGEQSFGALPDGARTGTLTRGDRVLVFREGFQKGLRKGQYTIRGVFPDHPERSPLPAALRLEGELVGSELGELVGGRRGWVAIQTEGGKEVRYTIPQALFRKPEVFNLLMEAKLGEPLLLEVVGDRVLTVGTRTRWTPPKGTRASPGVFKSLKEDLGDGNKKRDVIRIPRPPHWFLILKDGREFLVKRASAAFRVLVLLKRGDSIAFGTTKGWVVWVRRAVPPKESPPETERLIDDYELRAPPTQGE